MRFAFVERYRMRARIAATLALAALAVAGTAAADPALIPGLYRVEVRIALPNVQNVAPPLVVKKCITPADLRSGQAFSVLSDNPLKTCDLLDYEVTGNTAAYRIACAGPNRGSAVGVFDTGTAAYRGTIRMNMGGKNMTMSETQAGKRIGDCEPADRGS
jgi:hypothetical protein